MQLSKATGASDGTRERDGCAPEIRGQRSAFGADSRNGPPRTRKATRRTGPGRSCDGRVRTNPTVHGNRGRHGAGLPAQRREAALQEVSQPYGRVPRRSLPPRPPHDGGSPSPSPSLSVLVRATGESIAMQAGAGGPARRAHRSVGRPGPLAPTRSPAVSEGAVGGPHPARLGRTCVRLRALQRRRRARPGIRPRASWSPCIPVGRGRRGAWRRTAGHSLPRPGRAKAGNSEAPRIEAPRVVRERRVPPRTGPR